jgi:hypothetical protein
MPQFSMQGWSFKKWFAKNLSPLKTIVSLAAGIAGAYLSTLVISKDLAALLALVLSLGSRFCLDYIDFYFTEEPK